MMNPSLILSNKSTTHKISFNFVKTLQALLRDFHASAFLICCEQVEKEFFLNLCTGRSLTESDDTRCCINPLKPELNPIFYLLALLGAHHFLHVSRRRVKLLTFRRLMAYIYGAPILDVSRSHTTTQHSR